MIIDRAFNHERLIEFFEALVSDGRRLGKKVFLILDNLGVHHCKPVKAWLAEHAADIEVFDLPSYSPKLNPDECLNADLKHAIGPRMPVRTKARLRAAAEQHMQFIEANPQRMRSYFQNPIVRYAAKDIFVQDQYERWCGLLRVPDQLSGRLTTASKINSPYGPALFAAESRS